MSSSQIESVLHENRVFDPPQDFAKTARIGSMQAYNALVAEAEANYGEYWAKRAREEIAWHKPFSKSLDESQA
ncbi:MAG: acetate--CoA ligase, partial [Pseudomonadota bacterium]